MLEKEAESIFSRIKLYQPSFIFGTSASAHQVEGNNDNDWTEFENIEGNIVNGDRSGDATNHFELYNEDFALLEELGFSAHRLSIEWSRIFPERDEVNQDAIHHYRNVLKSLRDHSQISFVTLHHFTSPKWFIKLGGFKNRENLQYWDDFVKVVCNDLGDLIDVFNTINEPMVYATTSYLQGVHAPGEKSLFSFMKVANNLLRAHFSAVAIVREFRPDTPVGIVKNLIHFTSRNWNPVNKLISWVSDIGFNKWFNRGLKNGKIPFGFSKIKDGDIGDFVGINYYLKMVAGLTISDFMVPHDLDEHRLTEMGWGVQPKGMYKEIKRFVENIDLPVFITENGIATKDDEWRIEYVNKHLAVIADLLEEGVDIRGYFYWSFIDNFEWAEGYHPTFGLIEFDKNTFERKVKPSGNLFGSLNSIFINQHSNIKFE